VCRCGWVGWCVLGVLRHSYSAKTCIKVWRLGSQGLNKIQNEALPLSLFPLPVPSPCFPCLFRSISFLALSLTLPQMHTNIRGRITGARIRSMQSQKWRRKKQRRTQRMLPEAVLTCLAETVPPLPRLKARCASACGSAGLLA
jgi:hypothetical protein